MSNPAEKEQPKDEENNESKLLSKKRKQKFTLEDIINVYCCRHKIADNEIQEKIKTIYYEKPDENVLINYNKDKGDFFPLSHHIQPSHMKKDNQSEEEYKDDNEEKKVENEEQSGDEISKCFICDWVFLKGMSLHEKNTHINLCAEGKGEENKKELISTYKEIENLKNQNQSENNNNNKDVKQKENNEDKDKENEDKKRDEINSNSNNNNDIKNEDEREGEEDEYDDENDDLLL